MITKIIKPFTEEQMTIYYGIWLSPDPSPERDRLVDSLGDVYGIQIEMPCGVTHTISIEELRTKIFESTPCPCGNPRHWIIFAYDY
jgi:hypothetical protein